jgi:hypothetical protein
VRNEFVNVVFQTPVNVFELNIVEAFNIENASIISYTTVRSRKLVCYFAVKLLDDLKYLTNELSIDELVIEKYNI